MAIIKGAKLLTRLKPRTLAGLPSAIGLRTGTSFAVTDYGGNIATAVNGVWRFEYPFRTTWAGRPAVGLVPAGTELQATDYNNQKWISDGTNWRPAQGRAVLYMKSADGSASLATLTNITSAEFAITKPVIKAGMIIPYSRLRIEGITAKNGAVQAYTPAVYLGKTNSMVTDPAIGSIGGTLTADAASCRWDLLAHFGSSTTMFFRSGALAPQGQATASAFSQATNVDTTVDMYVTLSILASTAVADIYALKSYSVILEA